MAQLQKKEFAKMDTKARIEALVKDYAFGEIEIFRQEYQAFVKQTKPKKENLKDEYGSTGMDVAERGLHEIPETLYNIFKKSLRDEEFQWLMNTKQGSIWFAKKFKEFAIGNKV